MKKLEDIFSYKGLTSERFTLTVLGDVSKDKLTGFPSKSVLVCINSNNEPFLLDNIDFLFKKWTREEKDSIKAQLVKYNKRSNGAIKELKKLRDLAVATGILKHPYSSRTPD